MFWYKTKITLMVPKTIKVSTARYLLLPPWNGPRNMLGLGTVGLQSYSLLDHAVEQLYL